MNGTVLLLKPEMLDPPFRHPPKFDESRVIAHVGGPIDETSICLRVFGDDLDPDEVTARLGIQPTSHCRKGDVFRGKKYDRIEKTGRWLLARPHVTEDVDSIIQRLLKELPNSPELWREFHSKFKVDLFLGIWLRDWNRGFSLTPETLTMLADRKLEIGFDIYCDVTQPDLEFRDGAEQSGEPEPPMTPDLKS